MSRISTLNKIFYQPLAISKAGSAGLKMALSLMLDMKSITPAELKERGLCTVRSARPATDWDGEAIQQMEMIGDIAVIPIKGIMMSDIPQWAKEIGYADVTDIKADIDKAASDPRVAGIMLDVDSPGGSSLAGEELRDAVQELVDENIPVAAYVKGLAASAAYQSIAPAHSITNSAYAEIGSIGTYSVIVDDSEFWQSKGITYEVIASGKFKGMGIVGHSDDQRQYVQDRVNAFGENFRAGVQSARPDINADDMQGQTFFGRDAAARGFSDGLQKNLQNAVEDFSGNIKQGIQK